MSELKTKQNEASVNDFINSIAEEQKRKDLDAIKDLMEKATKAKAKIVFKSVLPASTVGALVVWVSGRLTAWSSAAKAGDAKEAQASRPSDMILTFHPIPLNYALGQKNKPLFV